MIHEIQQKIYQIKVSMIAVDWAKMSKMWFLSIILNFPKHGKAKMPKKKKHYWHLSGCFLE